jgi:3-hydroxyacyl-[acyl-carrier-protein] dehydratase
LLFNLAEVDLQQVCLDQAQIYEHLPQRHEFMLLQTVCHVDTERRRLVCFRDIEADGWWFRGHVPGRPLLPGVVMLEMAAQASALLAKLVMGYEEFLVFGGVDNGKFRETVKPGARLYVLAVSRDIRPRRVVSDVQGVVEGKLIFEASVTGMMAR